MNALRSGRSSPRGLCPLNSFNKAKAEICSVFEHLGGHVNRVAQFVTEDCKHSDVLPPEDLKSIANIKQQIDAIKEVIKRDHMKVVFFGRTSNGKSTMVNALLGSKILPTGLGHTTNCFLEVKGTDEDEAFMIIQGVRQACSPQKIADRVSATSSSVINPFSLIQVFYPKRKSHLLRENAVLLDTPGADIDTDIDRYIDQYCQDADVFVLVANAESTIMQVEKNFFHKVSEKLSRPNLFILYNRWDAAVFDPDLLGEVRKQHVTRAVNFLTKELAAYSLPWEAKERIFFISAKEVLIARSSQNDGNVGLRSVASSVSGTLEAGHEKRLEEFVAFEKKFEESISSAAISTKFRQHLFHAKEMLHDTDLYLRTIQNKFSKAVIHKSNDVVKRREKLSMYNSLIESKLPYCKEKAHNLGHAINKLIRTEVRNVVQMLPKLIKDFSMPFYDDVDYLEQYRDELCCFLNEQFATYLHEHCTSCIQSQQASFYNEVEEIFIHQLSAAAQAELTSLFPVYPIEPEYHIDFFSICQDFKPNLEFQFSLSPSSVMQMILSSGSGYLSQGLALTGISSLGSVTPMLAAGFFIYVTGWQTLIALTSLGITWYGVERFTWNISAKQTKYKRLFVFHTSDRIRQEGDFVAVTCQCQFVQDVTASHDRVKRLLYHEKWSMVQELNKVDKKIPTFHTLIAKAKSLQGHSPDIEKEIQNFSENNLDSSTGV